MKKSISVIFLFVVMWSSGIAQDYYQKIDSLNNMLRDSIMQKLAISTEDTTRVHLLNDMCNYFKFDKPDSALYYGYEAISLSRQIKFPEGEVRAMHNIALSQNILGNISKGLQFIFQGLKIADKNNLTFEKALLRISLGGIYRDTEDYNKALSIYNEALILTDSLHRVDFSIITRSFIGDTYLIKDQYDSALNYIQSAYDQSVRLNINWVANIALIHMGKLQEKLGNTSLALSYFSQSTEKATAFYWLFQSYYSIAKLFQHSEMVDSCIYYSKRSLEIAQKSGILSNIIDASILLAIIYDKSDPQKALEYNKMAIFYKDSLYNIGNHVAIEYFTAYDEQQRRYEIEAAKTEFRNRLRMNAYLGSTFTLIVIAIFLFRNNRQKQKSKQKIEKAYDQLKDTQSQLIQSEKMASLGELTAGIAHEIQNPLNFVNNFSEVNKELAAELLEEIRKGNGKDAEAIITDMIQNEEKILSHGQRADTIVKGMLQHSRANKGEKELTDLNTLCDEYLRLAYHGMRAKDKSFNAEFKLELDPDLPKVNVVPQDIGRVLLNLINNAFQAGSLKAEAGSKGYLPEVTVSTKAIPLPGGARGGFREVQITVQDNGPGIPENIRDKIFQPFFTTKPAGQGTGLGLSLSYDIVKAHGGKVNVMTKQNEGTEFTIVLGVKNN